MPTHFTISVTNSSTLVTHSEVLEMCRACASQMRHAAVAWERSGASIKMTPNATIPADAWPIILFDNPDQAGALGYHDETPQGQPYGRVFVKPTLDAGGAPLVSPNGLSVASVLSHEILEAWIDPFVDLWADMDDRTQVAYEVGDPVEDQSYVVATASGASVQVSDFVFPRWFDAQAPPGSQFSFMQSVSAPFTMTPGGYWIERTAGQTSQRFGEHYPDWKRDTKTFPAARTARRMLSA